MPTISVKVTGVPEVQRMLERLSPRQTRDIVVQSLLDCASLVQANAKEQQMIPGGDAPPDPKMLTSRRGGAGLQGSIAVNRQPLPAAIEVGTHLVYGRIHELGEGNYPKRAFLEPAVLAVEDRFPDVFMKNWRKIARV